MRYAKARARLRVAFFIALLLIAFLSARRLEIVLEPELVPFAEMMMFAAVAMLLTASALRLGLAQGSHLAYTDELTGLDNRRSFMERLADRLLYQRQRGELSALLLLDLDRFKLVNDTLGHPAGDELLKIVAARLRSCVPADAFVARLGGDEFAVIATVRDAREAMFIADDILDGLNKPAKIKSQDVWPNASIGVALPGPLRIAPGELMSMADVALYQAKGRGKGRAFLFDSRVSLPSINKLSLESELHMAVRYKQFEMYYQPIVDLKKRHIVAAEALLRWNHPTQGVLTPDAFLALANEAGIAQVLGRWIIEEVAAQSRTWTQLFGNRLTVGVNISTAEFQTRDFVYSLSRLLKNDEATARGLNLEIAESTLASEDATIQNNLAELRQLGFKLSIDDFGVGFSSLNYLKAHQVEVLKLDRMFVQSEAENERTVRIIRSIVEFAHSLGMIVVAEGIETEEQYHRMLLARCDRGQGYYFARAMQPQQLTDLLANNDLTLPVGTRLERRSTSRIWSRTPGPEVQDIPQRRGA